ncbi:MAG: hypothetical protein L6Q81_02435 [Bacteroidia bacterium]|nr:hypothetical protein [Bacteroidia bacterium]
MKRNCENSCASFLFPRLNDQRMNYSNKILKNSSTVAKVSFFIALLFISCSEQKSAKPDITGKWLLENVFIINPHNEITPYEDGGIYDPIYWEISEEQILKNFMEDGASKSNAFPYKFSDDSTITEQVRFKMMSVNENQLVLLTLDSAEEFTGEYNENCVKKLIFVRSR